MSSAAKKLIGTTALEQAAVTGGATDPETVLLLTGDGTDGAQNNTFLDSSSNNHTITRNGNVTQGTFTPFSKEEGKWGNYFDESGDYLQTDGSDDFGTGDFTVEAWIYPTIDSGSDRIIVDTRSSSSDTGFVWFLTSSEQLAVFTSGGLRLTSSTSLSVNSWSHVVFTRESGTIKFFINGVSDATVSYSTTITSPNNYRIGARNDLSESVYFNGYMSNLRIVSGTAVYTSAFTPSTTPLTAITNTSLLTCQSNRFVDNSSNNHSITATGTPEVTTFSPFANSSGYDPAVVGGSGLFADGPNKYLQVTEGSEFDFGTGDFTIECWYYHLPKTTSDINTRYLIHTEESWGGTRWILYTNNNDNKFSFFTYQDFTANGNTRMLSSTSDLVLNQWHHLALTRSGNTFRIFINGVLEDSSTRYTGAVGADTYPTYIGGGAVQTNRMLSGIVSNARIVKGTALYTSDFTPPTEPLTEVSGTSLLCNFTNAGIIDSSLSNVIETVGNAQIDTTVVKYGTGAMEFDGAGDYLKVTPSSSFYFGTNDFTIEFWINTTVRSSDSGERRIFKLHGPASSVADQIQLLIDDNSGVIEFYSNTTVLTGTTAVDDGSWHHIALVRNSGTTTLFIDGSSEDSAADTTDYDVSTEPSPIIGSFNGTAGDFNGYIDDLRITKGLARYTTNFTPPGALIEQ